MDGFFRICLIVLSVAGLAAQLVSLEHYISFSPRLK